MKKFKLVLAVILILAIVGVIFMTDFGQPVGDFLTGNLGSVTSLFTGNKGPAFGVNMKINRDALIGQTFKISNSTATLVGVPTFLRLNFQVVSLKEAQVVNMVINNFKGNVVMNSDGSISIDGETNYVEMDNFQFSSDKPKKIELNAGSNSLSIDNFNSDKIALASASGTVERIVDKNIDSASFDGKIEMNNFVGVMKLTDTTAEFMGIATSVKGDKFSFM